MTGTNSSGQTPAEILSDLGIREPKDLDIEAIAYALRGFDSIQATVWLRGANHGAGRLRHYHDQRQLFS